MKVMADVSLHWTVGYAQRFLRRREHACERLNTGGNGLKALLVVSQLFRAF